MIYYDFENFTVGTEKILNLKWSNFVVGQL